LFYLLEYVRKEYDVVVYFIVDGPAVKFYRESGIRCVVDTTLGKLPHCTIENQSLNLFSLKFYFDLKTYIKHYLKLIPSYFRMKRIIEIERPDIVHLNSTVLISEGLAAKAMKIPLVWHLRDFLEYGNCKLRYRVFRRIIQSCADVVIALCESELQRVQPVKHGRVIPNFVSFENFNYLTTEKADLHGLLGLKANTKIIGILGWHTPAKGALVLLKAFALIKDKQPDAVVVLFGEGPRQLDSSPIKKWIRQITGKRSLRAELQQIIKSNNLEDRVFFPGVIFEIARYIAAIDIVVAPFTKPHFARPILEAGAMKTLVIASNIDGVKEMILNGKGGYLAEPNDFEEWADKINLALSSDNGELIDTMYENTLKMYNAENNAVYTISVYQTLLC